MNVSHEQPRKRRRGRHGRWRRTSKRAGVALALFATAGASAGLGLSASAASATPRHKVNAAKPSHTRVWGGWRAPQAQVGHMAQLSAGTMLGAAPGQQLRYRWSILSRPRGSRARLLAATRAHPRLRPDRPGRSVLQVKIGRVPAGADAATRSLCASGCSTRRITVSATVTAGPLGVPVETIAYGGDGWGVQVGSPSAPGSQFYAAPTQGDALQLLVLDRGTLALVENESFANHSAGVLTLNAAVSSLNDSDLVIVTKPDPLVTDTPDDPAPASIINTAPAKIGVSPIPAEVSTGIAAMLRGRFPSA